MQLIRSHQILRFLSNLSLHRRQQFRTHRRVQYIQKHLLQSLIPAHIRAIFYQMPHQRFGNAPVHTVHGHMVAIVRRPSKSQFGHVPCTDHQPVFPVGNIHQYLSPLPGLAVFIGDIMIFLVLSNIPEMCVYRFPDIHFFQCQTENRGQPAGIVIGSVRRAETGHRHRQDTAVVHGQQIKGPYRCQQRQCGIQSSGYTDYRFFAAGMLHPLFQSIRLNGQDFLAPHPALRLFRRHKRHTLHRPCHLRFLRLQVEFHNPVPRLLRCRPGVHPAALKTKTAHIQFTAQDIGRKLFLLCQNMTVFRDQIVAAKNKILGGFPFSCAAINIPCHQSGAGGFYKHLPIGIFADGFIGS